MNEAQIIEGCIKKERKAQDAFFATYNGLLFGVCLRYAKNRFEAEDVLQEGLVKIYKNMYEDTLFDEITYNCQLLITDLFL